MHSASGGKLRMLLASMMPMETSLNGAATGTTPPGAVFLEVTIQRGHPPGLSASRGAVRGTQFRSGCVLLTETVAPSPTVPPQPVFASCSNPCQRRAALMGQVIGSESRKCVGEDDALCDRHSGNKNDAQHHHAGPAAPFMSLLKGFRSEILKSNHPQRLLSASWAAASSLRALL